MIKFKTIATAAAPAAAEAFSASFSWKGIASGGKISPPFAIRNAPMGTASLKFALHDSDAPDFQHGGSIVDYDGKGKVAKGAVKYTGPCPPSGHSHRYVWSITALDAGGKILGAAEAEGVFPLK